MHQKKALKGITLLHSPTNFVNQHSLILISVFIVAMSPVVSGSWNIINKLAFIEEFSKLTFKHLINDSLFHINYDCSGFQIGNLTPDFEVAFWIGIAEKWTQGIIIYFWLAIGWMLSESQVPESVAYLVAALANLNGNELAWHMTKYSPRKINKFENLTFQESWVCCIINRF